MPRSNLKKEIIMVKVVYYMSENGPTLRKPSEEYDYVSREDCLNFLDYLIRKGHHIEERKLRGLFNVIDRTKHDEDLLNMIRSCNSAHAAYEAYGKKCQKNRTNPNHKLMPELENIYREDLYEYLIENDTDEAEKISEIISNGEYKEYRRHNKMILSETFDLWAKGCLFLPGRNTFQNRFRIDYQLYCNREEYDRITRDVSSITFWCENTEDLRVGKDDIVSFTITDLFEAYSPTCQIIHRKPVEIKHQIMKIQMKLGTKVEGLCRQHDLYERLNSFNDVSSIDIEYENGEKKEIIIKWSELSGEAHGETDFNQKHICDIENGKLTGTFTSTFIIDYWAKKDTKNEKDEKTEKESNEEPAEFV